MGVLTLVYNYLIFRIFNFYPDVLIEEQFMKFSELGFYSLIFLKNSVVGVVLMFLFNIAYLNIREEHIAKGVLFFVLYALFAFVCFSFGDMLLMKTGDRMLVLLTFDGFVESLIATMPLRFFHK